MRNHRVARMTIAVEFELLKLLNRIIIFPLQKATDCKSTTALQTSLLFNG